MASTTICPICRLENISGDQDNCPQCDSDLTCFRVLDALPEHIDTSIESDESDQPEMPLNKGGEGKNRSSFIFLSLFLLFGFMGILLGFQIYWFNGLKSRLLKQQTGLERKLQDIELKLNANTANQEKILAVSTRQRRDKDVPPFGKQPIKEKKSEDLPQTTGTTSRSPENTSGVTSQKQQLMNSKDYFIYQAGDDDTLWDISKKFYTSGFYYPVLLEHNPELYIYSVGSKDYILILRNVQTVKQIYDDITEKKGNTVYWKYTVKSGDTIDLINKKYFNTRKRQDQPFRFDPHVSLIPGNRIKIPLE